MPARAIKLLKDPRWRATPLYTLLSQAGGERPAPCQSCLTEGLLLLTRRPGKVVGRTRRREGGGKGGPGRKRTERQSLVDPGGVGCLKENKKAAQLILSGHFNSSHISVISPPFDLVNA